MQNKTGKKTEEVETVGMESPSPMLLIDALRAKKARVATKAKRAIAHLDRYIRMLEDSDAEAIVRDAQNALCEDEG